MAKLALVLDDMLHQIGNVQLWTENRTFEDFTNDEMVRMAIERALEVVSEASRRIPPAEKDRFPDIPWQDIASIGNILRHEYHDAKDDVLWDITQSDDLLRGMIFDQGGWANIPPKSNRKDPVVFSPHLYKARNTVERFFNKIKFFRRISTRYDKLGSNYLAMVKLAAIRLHLRFYESTA